MIPTYQISSWSKKNYTWESANKLSRSKSLTGSLSIHLTRDISHERNRPTYLPKVPPYQISPQSEKSTPGRALMGLVGQIIN